MEDLLYKIGVSIIPGVGPITARKLISYTGSEEAVFKEKKTNLLKIPGVGEIVASKLNLDEILKKATEVYNFTQRYNIKTFFYLDKNYPKSLQKYDDSPIILYTKGDIDFNKGKFLSVVGTRSITHYGENLCNNLITDLAKEGFNPIIVSGLAYGVDATAHTSALNNSLKTIAVLGHGLDRIYPSSHKELAQRIMDNGALITEFINNSPIDASNFVRRNRIIAGLSEAVIVIESPLKGGSLITAEYAVQYSKDVFAFPGRSGDKYSAGCNYLIKTNRAGLIEKADDLIYNLSWEKNEKKAKQPTIFIEFNEDEKIIVDLLSNNELINVDTISYETNMPINKVLSLLFGLELNGAVKALPGRMYKLIN